MTRVDTAHASCCGWMRPPPRNCSTSSKGSPDRGQRSFASSCAKRNQRIFQSTGSWGQRRTASDGQARLVRYDQAGQLRWVTP
jgi:hypothetical protein